MEVGDGIRILHVVYPLGVPLVNVDVGRLVRAWEDAGYVVQRVAISSSDPTVLASTTFYAYPTGGDDA